MSDSITLRAVQDPAHCHACFAVMRELRPHLSDADAFVAAVDHESSIGETLNVIDDDLPTVGEYVTAVAPLVQDAPRLVSLPTRAVEAMVGMLDVANQSIFHGRVKLPSGLRPAPFAARFRPLRYDNARAKAVLQWAPRIDFNTAVARCVSSSPGVAG